MQIIQVHDKKFQHYISHKAIQEAVARLGKQISEDFVDKCPVLLAVLNGSFMFASDLMKHLEIDCEISFVKLQSYQGMESTKNIRQLIGLDTDIAGRAVIIVEDIIDTGHTMQWLIAEILKKQASDIKVACLLLKPDAVQYAMQYDYIGFKIPNKFVVGYGLDYQELGRNYPAIYQLADA